MAATATARKTAPRAAARPRRAAPQPMRPGPRLVPVAVGRTAVAVGGIADSGMVLRLTRSRLWIGLLGSLLVGIVALNVFALSFNASSSKTAGIADELRRENSALATQIADGLSNERLQAAADRLGLIVPEPGAILYLEPRPGDAAAAAARLRQGAITLGSTYIAPPPIAPPVTTSDTELPATDTAATATTDPATTDPAVTATETPVAADPAVVAPTGGVTVGP